MLKKNLLQIFRRFSYLFGKVGLDNSWDMSDIFIVSYPKSGTTYLCLILANILKDLQKDPRRVDFYSVHDYVPDLHANPQRINQISPQRFIKTHESFEEWNSRISVKGRGVNYPRVIYLIREGKKTMASSYMYARAMSVKPISFSDFIMREKSSRGAWDDHVNGWLLQDNGIDKKMVQIIKYEDLLENTLEVIKSLLEFSGLNVGEGAINKAIENSDIYKIRELESQFGNGVIYFDREYKFARDGSKREISERVIREVNEYFENNGKEVLDQLGY